MLLRGIILLFLSVSFLIPGGFAALHGHGRNGYSGWSDTMYMDSPFGIAIWTVIGIWMIYPFFKLIREYMK